MTKTTFFEPLALLKCQKLCLSMTFLHAPSLRHIARDATRPCTFKHGTTWGAPDYPRRHHTEGGSHMPNVWGAPLPTTSTHQLHFHGDTIEFADFGSRKCVLGARSLSLTLTLTLSLSLSLSLSLPPSRSPHSFRTLSISLSLSQTQTRPSDTPQTHPRHTLDEPWRHP